MLRLDKFLALHPGDRQLLINTFSLLGIIRLGLWLLPFHTLLRNLESLKQPQPRSHQVPVTQIVQAVNLSCRYMPGQVKCLARALTTQVLLSRHGHNSELRIGVAKGKSGTLEAHAWVEYQGQVAIGQVSNLSNFVPLPNILSL